MITQKAPGILHCDICGRDHRHKSAPEKFFCCAAPLGLGDRMCKFLLRLGIRKRPGCGCGRRQAWLNRFGERVARAWRWLTRR